MRIASSTRKARPAPSSPKRWRIQSPGETKWPRTAIGRSTGTSTCRTTMMSDMKPVDITHAKPRRYASPGKPRSEFPL
jgi:hypothetical protein